MSSALTLFSGGQDSTIALAWALDRHERVETVGFAYGQRHAVEMECRPVIRREIAALDERWAVRLGEDHVLDLSVLGHISDTALTRELAIDTGPGGRPSTFVPGRNLVFLALASALAVGRSLERLIAGMCENDASGYPDCTIAAMAAMQAALGEGLGAPMPIETPLIGLDKSKGWALAHDLGGDALVDLIVESTHSCYLGERGRRWEWGYGCGQCPACHMRAEGWRGWRGQGDRRGRRGRGGRGGREGRGGLR